MHCTPNSTITKVNIVHSRSTYEYNPLYLLLSYGLAVIFTVFSSALGLHAVNTNGVIHSSAFSAIVATTRNQALDGIFDGSSLGVLPLDRKIEKVGLRFKSIDAGQKIQRAGFDMSKNPRLLKTAGGVNEHDKPLIALIFQSIL
jgi:hypothetical protein